MQGCAAQDTMFRGFMAELTTMGARRALDGRRWMSHAACIGAVVLAALTPSCDNPACIYGGDCSGNSNGGGGANPPTAPTNHVWIRDGAPTVTSALPSGTGAPLQAPLVLVFSESIASSTLSGAFEIAVADSPNAAPIGASALVADGRMWIGSPAIPLVESTEYELRVVENKVITDLQGSALTFAADRVVGRFTTAASTSNTPAVLTTFPADNATQQSATGELIVVFDRPVNPLTVTSSSLKVTVNNATPANNPEPTQLTFSGTLSDSRVWRYRSADALGDAVPFPPLATVQIEISPASSPILLPMSTTAVPRKLVDFTVASLAAPISAQLTSLPVDAIGSANFDGTAPLEISLDLAGAQNGDTLKMYVFGHSRDTDARATLLSRSATLDMTLLDELNQVATVGEAQIDLASSVSPVAVRLAEETLTIGFALARGSYQTPIRLMDVDTFLAGAQGPVLDVTPPTFTGLSTSGMSTTSFVTDQRDLVVVGRASEQVRACEVTIVGVADNGVQPLTVASNAAGLFVAKPIALGQIDPATLPFSARVRIYDRALNASVSSINPDVTQVGAIGPALAVPGASQIEVEVRDARTLAPVMGALVVTHEDIGVSVDVVDVGTTNVNGRITLDAGLVGEALVTVDATNYHLLTVHGVQSSRVSLLIEPTGAGTALLAGSLSTSQISIASLDNSVADSRAVDGDEPSFAVATCSSAGSLQVCPFGPRPIRAARLGGVGLMSIDPPTSAFNFSATSFLRAFAMQLPLGAANANSAASASLSISTLLEDPSVDQEDRALAGPAALLDASGVSGLTLSMLDGAPRVVVQGTVPGLGAPFLAGYGAALDPLGSPASMWELRSAIPGACDPTSGKYVGDELGSLFDRGTLVGDLFLRVELRDSLGARSVVRTPFASVGAVVTPPDAPGILSPTPASTTAGPEYDITFTDTLPNSGDPGIYRVTLIGSSGRRWVLWRTDGNGATRTVHVPDLVSAGGDPLPSGAVAATVRAYAYPTFDAAEFLFSDLDVQAESIADGVPTAYSQP